MSYGKLYQTNIPHQIAIIKSRWPALIGIRRMQHRLSSLLLPYKEIGLIVDNEGNKSSLEKHRLIVDNCFLSSSPIQIPHLMQHYETDQPSGRTLALYLCTHTRVCGARERVDFSLLVLISSRKVVQPKCYTRGTISSQFGKGNVNGMGSKQYFKLQV